MSQTAGWHPNLATDVLEEVPARAGSRPQL